MIGRRDFLKYCVTSAAALGLDYSVLGKLEKVFAAGNPTVLWLSGASCTGCTVSLANRFSGFGPVTDIADLLINYINLAYHPNLMAAAGDTAVQTLKSAASGDFILAVEGGIPTSFDGLACTLWTENGRDVSAAEAVTDLASRATAILSIGTCASFGGISAGNPNPTGVVSVAALTGKSTINIAGCPPHPDWIVGTVAQLLAGNIPVLNGTDNRPTQFFSSNVHMNCPNMMNGTARAFGRDGQCLLELGCKGPRTLADCPSRLWNNGTNWCIGANSVCVGCTEDGFPDAFSPFYTEVGRGTASENQPKGNALSLTRCEWISRESTLWVEGKGTVDAVVMLKNARSRAMLGATNVNSDGIWKIRINHPSPVPRRVRAESLGMAREATVRRVKRYTTSQPNSNFERRSEWLR